MPIERELLEFASTRPAWQQDVIRRICTQADISSDDIAQVLANIKASQGLAEAHQMIPVAEDHLSQRTPGQHSITKLAAISDVKNANQLAPSQHLPFALNGITLIYGDNGSGKTGYARIVKCTSSEPFGQVGTEIKRGSGPSGLKFWLRTSDAAGVELRWFSV